MCLMNLAQWMKYIKESAINYVNRSMRTAITTTTQPIRIFIIVKYIKLILRIVCVVHNIAASCDPQY